METTSYYRAIWAKYQRINCENEHYKAATDYLILRIKR